jgi:hypothetical protein
MINKYFLNLSKEYTDIIKQNGKIAAYHACGRNGIHFKLKTFDEFKPNLIEGFACETIRDIMSIKGARNVIDKNIILRRKLI